MGWGSAGSAATPQLEPPLKVNFGKVGAHAFALGEGTLTVHRRVGAVSLHRVLYVPELAGNLFSTRVAVNRGAANLFLPAAHPDGEHRVAIVGDAKVVERPGSLTVEGQVVLTASLSEGLYLLDLLPDSLTAPSAMPSHASRDAACSRCSPCAPGGTALCCAGQERCATGERGSSAPRLAARQCGAGSLALAQAPRPHRVLFAGELCRTVFSRLQGDTSAVCAGPRQ